MDKKNRCRKNRIMNYAIEILKKHKKHIENTPLFHETGYYPEARKDRDKKLKEINEAIELLTSKTK